MAALILNVTQAAFDASREYAEDFLVFSLTIAATLILRMVRSWLECPRTSYFSMKAPPTPSGAVLPSEKRWAWADDEDEPEEESDDQRLQPMTEDEAAAMRWVAEQADVMVARMKHLPSQRKAVSVLRWYLDLRLTLGLCVRRGFRPGADVPRGVWLGLDINSALRSCVALPKGAQDFYHLLLNCATRCERFSLVETFLDDMTRLNVERTLEFYEAAMKQLAAKREFALALRIYDRLVLDGLTASATTVQCLVTFAFEAGEVCRCVDFFEQLLKFARPSIAACSCVLRAYGELRDWSSAAALLSRMSALNIPVNHTVLRLALVVAAAEGRLADALELFKNDSLGFITPRRSLQATVEQILSAPGLSTPSSLIATQSSQVYSSADGRGGAASATALLEALTRFAKAPAGVEHEATIVECELQ
eukprot:TRINITY_DN54168_c0_g1_i1.p1 TRINITY_DN54168_c0_g1~~TRINITY_DN54168_c0_g1_i1.p1  ORF type:complete len:421 (-),score=100.38 TRINITY_DN54168_c0_g1_i1:73-1335(-)